MTKASSFSFIGHLNCFLLDSFENKESTVYNAIIFLNTIFSKPLLQMPDFIKPLRYKIGLILKTQTADCNKDFEGFCT